MTFQYLDAGASAHVYELRLGRAGAHGDQVVLRGAGGHVVAVYYPIELV